MKCKSSTSSLQNTKSITQLTDQTLFYMEFIQWQWSDDTRCDSVRMFVVYNEDRIMRCRWWKMAWSLALNGVFFLLLHLSAVFEIISFVIAIWCLFWKVIAARPSLSLYCSLVHHLFKKNQPKLWVMKTSRSLTFFRSFIYLFICLSRFLSLFTDFLDGFVYICVWIESFPCLEIKKLLLHEREILPNSKEQRFLIAKMH